MTAGRPADLRSRSVRRLEPGSERVEVQLRAGAGPDYQPQANHAGGLAAVNGVSRSRQQVRIGTRQVVPDRDLHLVVRRL